jgi:hypothetical protein
MFKHIIFIFLLNQNHNIDTLNIKKDTILIKFPIEKDTLKENIDNRIEMRNKNIIINYIQKRDE